MTDDTASSSEEVVITGDLARRPGRAPCHEGEIGALADIAESMANAPETVLQQLAEKAMKLTRSESAGISLLEDHEGIETFRWVATAGAFAKNLGGTMPRHESPCGMVVDRNDLLLVRDPVRLFPALRGCDPHIHEVLLAPLSIEGETVGTVWALKHSPEGRFDAEDARLLQSLARFASAGARAVEARRATEALREETAAERARADAALHDSQDRYRTLFEAIDSGFCIIEMIYGEDGRATDYRFVEVNPAFERQSGLVDAVGRRIREFAPNLEEHWLGRYGRVALTGESMRIEGEVAPLGRWFDINAFRVGAPGQHRVAVLFTDITDRIHAESTLRASQEQFEILLNQAPLGVYLVDGAFKIRQVNPIALPVFGDIDGGAVGRDFDEVIHILWDKNYADEVVRIFRHTLETGEPYVTPERAEYRVDRDVIEYYEWRLDRIILSDGQYGVVCYFRDISAQVHARKEIEKGRDLAHESEERLRLIVENAQDYAIFTTDPDGIVTDWRAGAVAVFGYTGEEMTGKSCNNLFVPEDREARQPERERATAAEQGKASDVRWHLRKDGSRVFMDGVSTALRDPDGRLVGFLKIAQDVTDRHSADERQRLLLAELQHRVRNILAMIRSVARRTAETSDTVREYAQHLEGRINAMARTQAILTRKPGSPVDLQGIVDSELLSVVAQEDKVWCEGPEVCLEPKAAEILTLAIHELATNAVKYGAFSQPAGQLEIRWEVEDRGAEPWLVFTWEEARVEGVLPNGREGFGTELITRRVPYELGGSGTYELRPGGIRTVIECPLREGGSILETGARGLGEAA